MSWPTGILMDGLSVRHGAGAPAAGLGQDGDFYIDTSGPTLYGPKAAALGRLA